MTAEEIDADYHGFLKGSHLAHHSRKKDDSISTVVVILVKVKMVKIDFGNAVIAHYI